MTWAIIIAAIISVVGPYIAAWLQKHLHKHLTEVAENLAEPTSARDITKLCDVAIARLPRIAFAQRTLLRTVRRLVEKRIHTIKYQHKYGDPWINHETTLHCGNRRTDRRGGMSAART